MLLAAFRDLQWRKRRVAIAVIGTGLVLAMTMVLSGLSASFRAEADHFVGQLGASAFVFPSQADGPFSGSLPVPADQVKAVAALPGVHRASPLVFIQAPLQHEPSPRAVLVGVEIGGVGSPIPDSGRALAASGQVVVSNKLAKKPGDTLELGNKTFNVVGTVGATAFAGTAVVYMPIGDVDAVAFRGAKLATMFVTQGTPTTLPDSLHVDDPHQAVSNLIEPLHDAQSAISFMSILLWIVAACVLASAMYLSAMERSRDFAVFKATGVSNGALLAGLAIQARGHLADLGADRSGPRRDPGTAVPPGRDHNAVHADRPARRRRAGGVARQLDRHAPRGLRRPRRRVRRTMIGVDTCPI